VGGIKRGRHLVVLAFFFEQFGSGVCSTYGSGTLKDARNKNEKGFSLRIRKFRD
jgi:hypothetical protein